MSASNNFDLLDFEHSSRLNREHSAHICNKSMEILFRLHIYL